MTATGPGWPVHRPTCDGRDSSVATRLTVTPGGRLRLAVRRCGDCGAVAVSDTPDNPPSPVDGAELMEDQ